MERDRKIRRFSELFEGVLQRKGLILGENTIIPNDVAVSMASKAPPSSSAAAEDIEVEESDVRSSKPSLTKAELGEILKQQNPAELTATATEAVRRGGKSLLTATSRFDSLDGLPWRTLKAHCLLSASWGHP